MTASRAPGPVATIKVSLQEPTPQTALLQEKERLTQKQKPTDRPKKPKPVRRESVVAAAPQPEPMASMEQKEIQRSLAEPSMWTDERSEMTQKTSADAAPVDLPEPASRPIELADQKIAPIQKEVANVNQSRALSEKTADFKQTPADLPDQNYIPTASAAPNEVTRRKTQSDFRPEAQAAPQEISAGAAKPLQRSVAKQTAAVANMPVRELAPAPNLPASSQAAPSSWEGARTAAVTQEYQTQPGSVALPKVSANQGVKGGSAPLAEKARPVEAAVASVNPNVELRKARVEALSGPAKPVSAGKMSMPQAQDAPVEVIRNDPRARGAPSAVAFEPDRQVQVDGLLVSDAPVKKNTKGRTAGATAGASQGEAPRSVSDIPVTTATPAPNLPASSQAAPSSWEGARPAAVTQEYQTQPGSVALPKVPANQGVKGGAAPLAEKARPVEAAVASVNPNVELRKAHVAGLAGPANPVSSGKMTMPQAQDAPVEVIRNAPRARGAPSAVAFEPDRQVQVDGLLVSDAPVKKNAKGRTAGATAGASQGEAPRSVSDIPVTTATPAPNLPTAPEADPEKWVDAAQAGRTAMAEKTSIAVSSNAVTMPSRSKDQVETFGSASPVRYDVVVEDVVSEFDVLTLSDGGAAATASRPATTQASAASGDGGTHRALIKSELPEIPAWYEEKGINSVGTFRVHITAAGDVDAVDVEKTTGYKDIDAGCVAVIMNWKYEKAETATTRPVKLRFKLRK